MERNLIKKIGLINFVEELIKSDRIKIDVLRILYKRPRLTASRIASLINNQYESVKNALNFLETINLVKKTVMDHGEKAYEYYALTNSGKEISKNV